MKRNCFVTAAVIVIAIVGVGIFLYPSLPDRVPTHWDLHGQANGYSGRLQAVALMPAIMTCMILLFAALPWLSPRNFEVNGGDRNAVYLQIMLVILGFMAYVQVIMLTGALGRRIGIPQAIMGGICVLFAALGVFIARLRRNFYVGVRTPWTLASERVWDSTHRFAARTFVFAGVAGIVFALIPRLHASMVTLAAGAIAPVIYSLVYYKQLERRGEV
jgi:uncharacterized membrane protein